MTTIAALLYLGGMITAWSYASEVLVDGNPRLAIYEPRVRKAAIAFVATFWIGFPIAVLVKMAIKATRGWPR